MGYDAGSINQAADQAADGPDEPWRPGSAEGAYVSAVCEAMERSATERRWVGVNDVVATAPGT